MRSGCFACAATAWTLIAIGRASLRRRGPADCRTHRPVLYFLGMGFDELLEGLVSVIPVLDYQTVRGKAALDSLLAGAMLPLIPAAKRGLWKSPSSTAGLKHRQSAGRPCPSCCAPAPLWAWWCLRRETGKAPSLPHSNPGQAGRWRAGRTILSHWSGCNCAATAPKNRAVLPPGLAVPGSRRGACGRRRRI